MTCFSQRSLCLVAFVLAVVITAVAQLRSGSSAQVLQKQVLGQLQQLQNTRQIRVYRIQPSLDIPAPHKSFLGFQILAESSQTNATFAKAVATALLSEENYSPPGATLCGFYPVIGFELGANTNKLNIAVCFSCNEVLLVPESKPNAGQRLHFSTIRGPLVKLTKQAFPYDKVVQGIRD